MTLYHVHLTLVDGTTEGDYVFTDPLAAVQFADNQQGSRADVAGYRIITVRSTADAIHRGPEQ